MPFEASDERYSYSVGALCSRLIDEHLARFSISFHDSTRVISVVSANLINQSINQSINPSLNQSINQAIARCIWRTCCSDLASRQSALRSA